MAVHVDATRHDDESRRVNDAVRTNRQIVWLRDDSPIGNPEILTDSIPSMQRIVDHSVAQK